LYGALAGKPFFQVYSKEASRQVGVVYWV